MGAKFNIVQPVQLCWIENSTLCIEDLFGKFHKVQIKDWMGGNFAPDKVDFRSKRVIVKIVQKGLIFVLRSTGTWSLISEMDTTLLDFGMCDVSNLNLDLKYEQVGFVKNHGRIFPLLLDMDSKLILHGIFEEDMSSGVDVLLTEPLKVNSKIAIETQFCKDLSLFYANNDKSAEDGAYAYNRDGVNQLRNFKIVER